MLCTEMRHSNQKFTNTSPAFPPVPQDGTSPMDGIETPTITDNLV